MANAFLSAHLVTIIKYPWVSFPFTKWATSFTTTIQRKDVTLRGASIQFPKCLCTSPLHLNRSVAKNAIDDMLEIQHKYQELSPAAVSC